MIKRRKSRQIAVGHVLIGGDAPISIQSMTTAFTHDVDATLTQIQALAQTGCDLVRVAVPEKEDAEALPEIAQRAPIPVIADVHFDYRFALLALDSGAACVRINPGNIGSSEKIAEIVRYAKIKKIPLRIGVNAGSLEKKFIKRDGRPTATGLVESAVAHVEFLESLGFFDFKISVKSSDVLMAVEAYRELSQRVDYPLHLGITEAGTISQGTVKSAVGIGILLFEGIGDTIRVSLTADPVKEVGVGWDILKTLGLRERGVVLVSCPSCGRCAHDFIDIVNEIEQDLQKFTDPLKVAVMGCEVNGPGEARDADIGIAFGDREGLLFRKGEKIKKVSRQEAKSALLAEIKRIQQANQGD
ncbi:MAG: flavodoxin-dependent (E)-4-hydroxy-3-methylbut-2-enyl-diphosphate synthase [Deltaproteobacteria bacterium]|nr:flavodoxin-dependent (E)-4-hydroxy-3-methylbut-2-enyl-diphosphate synthase [Deltaproteobacteria bacterium]